MRLGDFYYFNLPIPAGSNFLHLSAGDAGNGIAFDHAAWANAGFPTSHETK